jgi:choline monooxygenase
MARAMVLETSTKDSPEGNLPGRILRSSMEAVRRPLDKAVTLPTRAYTSEEFFRHEVDKVFMRSWLHVGRASQVPNPYDFFTITRFDERIIVVRDKDGVLHALSATCRHRGFPVADGSGNCSKTRGFVCPYHGWAYRADGSLAAAPFMQKGFDASASRLPEFGIDVWQGFIFINFDAAAPKLSPQLKTVDKVMDPFNLSAMGSGPLRRLDWPGNWKAMLDNFTEAYHQPLIHSKTFEPMSPARLAVYEDIDGPYNLYWLPSANGEPFPTLYPPIKGLPERLASSFLVVNIFPYFHMFIDASCIISLDMDIRSANDLRGIWDVHVPAEVAAAPDFEEKTTTFMKLLMPIFDEDEGACREVRYGQRSRFAEQGAFSWMEKSVHQLHSWLADRYLD